MNSYMYIRCMYSFITACKRYEFKRLFLSEDAVVYLLSVKIHTYIHTYIDVPQQFCLKYDAFHMS